MKNRIANGNPMTVISTILGTLIILASCYVFYLGKIDWTQLLVALGIGALMAGLKFNPGGIPPAPVLIFGLGLILNSCVTYSACNAKYGSLKDTIRVPVTITKEVPVQVVIRPDSTQFKLWMDSLKSLAVGDTVFIRDPKSKLTIKYWKDQYQNIVAQVKSPGDTITKTIYLTVHDTVNCPPSTIFNPPVKDQGSNEFLGLMWWKWIIVLVLMIGAITILKLLKN